MAAAFFLPDSLEVSFGSTNKVGILLLSGEAIKSVAPTTVIPEATRLDILEAVCPNFLVITSLSP